MSLLARAAFRLAVLGIAVLAISTVAVIAATEVMYARHENGRSLSEPVDAVIVLGALVDPDGTLGYSARRRVVPAVNLIKSDKIGAGIFTGGILRAHQTRAEGDLMRDYAISLGANPAQVFAEGQARTTFENLRYSFAIAEEKGFDRLAIATDGFHLTRAWALAWFWGKPDIDLIAARGLERDSLAMRAHLILREAMAWWYNLYKMAGWQVLGALGITEAERVDWIQ
ncbi:MAG: YdcF family protein [Pseudomonadota bacterium]